MTETETVRASNPRSTPGATLWGRRFDRLERRVRSAARRGHRRLAERFDAIARRRDALERDLRELATGAPCDWRALREELERATRRLHSLSADVDVALDGDEAPSSLRDRHALVARALDDAQRWSRSVDALVAAPDPAGSNRGDLATRLESLRHKRDSLLTKVEALRRHERAGWEGARRELEVAQRELRDAWRSAVNAVAAQDVLDGR